MGAVTSFQRKVQTAAERVAAYGPDALGALFDLTSPRLVRFAIAVTRNQHDAEDAVQAALVRVASRPQVLAPVACAWAYLLRMVRNEALLIARRQRRCMPGSDLSDLVTQCGVDELEREETYRAVWSALRTLPAKQAEVVVLKIWEEMTFAEVGAILEISPNTAASRYQYAMVKLSRGLLKQHREVCRD